MKIKGREPVLRFPTREALDLDLELQKIGHQRADAPELSSIFYLTLNTVASRENDPVLSRLSGVFRLIPGR